MLIFLLLTFDMIFTDSGLVLLRSTTISCRRIAYMLLQGMQIIESMDHGAFSAYLKRTQNTICGRHPIGVFLGAVNALKANKAMINGFRMDLQVHIFFYFFVIVKPSLHKGRHFFN